MTKTDDVHPLHAVSSLIVYVVQRVHERNFRRLARNLRGQSHLTVNILPSTSQAQYEHASTRRDISTTFDDQTIHVQKRIKQNKYYPTEPLYFRLGSSRLTFMIVKSKMVKQSQKFRSKRSIPSFVKHLQTLKYLFGVHHVKENKNLAHRFCCPP
jgi:hypothetical protein